MITILIVDDDALFGHMMKERLEREIKEQEATVMTSVSAEAAIKIIQQSEPHQVDIVLTDNRLSSGKNGLELLEWLAEFDPDIDSVLFTGLDEPMIGMRAYEAGAFRYLVKPFDPNELIWIVNSIIQKRSTRYERNWLATLNEVAATTQQALTTEVVAQTLVDGGVKLGFERARIYRVVTPYIETFGKSDKSGIHFHGYRQSGAPEIPNFHLIRMPYEQSDYVRRVYDEHYLKLFYGKPEVGYRENDVSTSNPNPPLGEWVGIPIINGGSCSAVLLMDNPSQKKVLRKEEHTLLKLFAQQASAAWERAEVSEQRQRRQDANTFARSIINRTSTEGQPNDLQSLLQEVFRVITKVTPTQNFVIAMKHHDIEIDEKGWLHYSLYVKDSVTESPRWRPPQQNSFRRHIIDHRQAPIYFPETTLAYRREHRIREPERIVQSIIAIPLIVGNESIGGVFIEDYNKQECWTPDIVELCCEIISQLAHYLQSAWINHQRTQLNEQLSLLQIANEKIMWLAQQQPSELPEHEWLWHATLTLATARYGFGFNRAMLFMVEEGESVLQGRMGIGHVSEKAAKRAWEKDEASGLDSFDIYIERLTTRKLYTVTPVDDTVRSLRFPKVESTAFAKIIATRQPVAITKQNARNELPQAFIKQFGIHDYWLVPANAGDHLVGILVLDTFCETEPPQTFAIKHIDTITNEAALIHENLRRSSAQRELLELSRSTINFAHQIPLLSSLRKIAHVTRLVTAVDTVSIYPLKLETNPPEIDIKYITWYPAPANQEPPHHDSSISPLMQYVLETGQPLTVNDVTAQHPSGLSLANDPVFIAKAICAFICVPIRDYSGRIDGLLYLNYRWVCKFSNEDVQQAEAFANLISVILRNWRERNELQIEKNIRDDELHETLEILQLALQPETSEELLIETLLHKVRAIFLSYDEQTEVNLAFALAKWVRSAHIDAESEKVFQQCFLDFEGMYQTTNETNSISGIRGKAMQESIPICVLDVQQYPWNEIYKERMSETRSEIDIPIVGEDGRAIGVLNVESPRVSYFTETHVEMLQRLCRVFVLAIDSIHRRQSMRSLLSAGEEITKPTDLRHTLDVVSQEVRAIIPSLSVMTVWYVEAPHERLVLGASTGIRKKAELREEYPRRQGAVEAIMQRNEPLWAEDVCDYDFFHSSKFIGREGIKSTAAFPLIISDKPIGAVFFSYRHQHYFTQSERELLPILAQYIAIGIHQAHLIDEARKERDVAQAEKEIAEKEQKRIQSILQVTERVSTIMEPEIIVRNTKPILQRLYGDINIVILFFDSASNSLKIIDNFDALYENINLDYKVQNRIYVDNNSMIGELALRSLINKKQESILIVDVENTNQLYLPYNKNTLSTVAVTFVDTAGELLGSMVVENETDIFTDDDVQLLEGVASQIGFAVERWQQSSAIDFRNVVTDSMMWAADLAHDLNRETYHIRSRLERLRGESNVSTIDQTAISQIEESINLIVQDAPSTIHEPELISDLAEVIVDWVQEYVKQYRITVNISATSGPVSIQLISPVLKRAIRYLTRNAAKAMNYRGSITIHTDYLDDTTVRIQFTDSGPGIKDDDPLRTRMFKEALSEAGKGGGLGLLFTRLHIEKLHGEIHLVEYEEGSGATFCIHLPLNDFVNEINGDNHG